MWEPAHKPASIDVYINGLGKYGLDLNSSGNFDDSFNMSLQLVFNEVTLHGNRQYDTLEAALSARYQIVTYMRDRELSKQRKIINSLPVENI